MRESLRDIDRLYHIKERIGNVQTFLEGKTFEEMQSDVMCFHAVVYNIMIIGEAANMLTKDFRLEHPEVPWRDIIDMRNVLVHGYYIASPKFVWDTYVNDLPILKQQVENYLNAL
jgi:uncharacterized protein with HEPN domain